MAGKRVSHPVGSLVVGLALLASACSASHSGTSRSDGSSSAIQLPKGVRARGTIDVGAFFNYPPYTMVTGGRLEGIEPELVRAVADKLGVEVRFHSLSFEAMIPSVVNRRSDLLIGMFADTAARRKQVGFVDLMHSSMRALVLKGNPKHVDPSAPCGRTVSESAGSYQEAVVKMIAARCAKEGKPALKMLTFPDPGTSFLAVINGRTQFTLQDPALARYTADKGKELEVLDAPVREAGGQVQGWIFATDNTGLRTAFIKAIHELIKEGKWQKIMDRSGIGDEALNPPTDSTRPVKGR
ncbi:transporter substrate-binding domain-containing protein [Streptomyces sp. NPDC058266]|uniref:transporter substrate-binding domain-containing protein n=1 Tax=Streptomyces sp. NPDC058266 TaxID=3346412 RepID=UPI0036F03904